MTTARPKLTPHQREVYTRICRLASVGQRGLATSTNIGSIGAARKLEAKGYITVRPYQQGPRGGITYIYEPVK